MVYAIVLFEDENSVAVIPLSWFADGKCYWPRYRGGRLDAAVRDNEQPDVQNWDCLEHVRLLRKYDSYSKARANLKQAECDTSALESDGYEPLKCKRRKKSRVIAEMDESEEDCENNSPASDAHQRPALPAVPPGLISPVLVTTKSGNVSGSVAESSIRKAKSMQRSSKTANNRPTEIGMSRPPTPDIQHQVHQPFPSCASHSAQLSTGLVGLEDDTETNSVSARDDVPSGPSGPVFAAIEPVALTSGAAVSASSSHLSAERELSAERSTTGFSVSRRPLAAFNQRASPCISSPTSYSDRRAETSSRCFGTTAPKDLHIILTRLAGIEMELKRLNGMVQSLVNSQNSDNMTELPEDIILPISSLDALHSMENLLADKDKLKVLVGYLTLLGGSTVGDTTRRMLREMFTNQMALTLNFAGRGNKVGIGSMNVVSAITAAVLKNKQLRATVAGVHNEIKVWLRQACDRAGGRRDPDRGTKRCHPVTGDQETN